MKTKIDISKLTTEKESKYEDLEKMSVSQIVTNINKEDQTVAYAVKKVLPQIAKLVTAVVHTLKSGGRLFYVGTGTSGRLGIVDASECPPTYGVPHGMVIGIIAGGDGAIRKSVEKAEDDTRQGFKDLRIHKITRKDFVLGISASGRTPYVVGALEMCQKKGIQTGCIVCTQQSEIASHSDFPIEVVVGPEFVTGSTRMKAGTAQKLILNMITTTTMIKIGRVQGNRMVHMQLTNNKLIERGTRMIMSETGLNHTQSQKLLEKEGSVHKALEVFKKRSK